MKDFAGVNQQSGDIVWRQYFLLGAKQRRQIDLPQEAEAVERIKAFK